MLVSGGANLLIIDEPTNHLDLESREALEDALRGFDGTLLLVSHDRALLDAIGTRTVSIEERRLESHMGGWADYVRVREERKAARRAGPNGHRGGKAAGGRKEKAGGGHKEKAGGGQKEKPAVSKDMQRRIGALEREIAAAEEALQKVEDELANPSAWSSPTSSARSAERHTEAKRHVEALYERLGELEPH